MRGGLRKDGNMQYIIHRRYKGPGLLGGYLNLPYGTTLELPMDVMTGKPKDDRLYTEGGTPVCIERSQVAKEHAARNDDGCGLERGALTWAIAYAPRKGDAGFRFTEDEIRMLRGEYEHWLRPYDVIMFNDDFFRAGIEDLQELAKKLQIKIRR